MRTTIVALICSVQSFDPSLRPRCYVTGQATVGFNQVNSPSYPKPAGGNSECLYVLSAPEGAKIEIHFDQFELLSCAEQELALLDPVQTQGPGQTELFCGRQKPVPYITHGNEVFMKYSSKTPLSSKGFLLKYRIAPGKGAKEATVQKEPQPRRENDTQMSADYMVDTPVADKQTKQLGSKSDIDTKRMLKWLVIGLGAIAGVIVAILVFRKVTGKAEEGYPQPEVTLPEGTIPTHLRAITEHKTKMHELGISTVESD